MPQLPQLEIPKRRPRKICVVGSTGHAEATCVEWSNVASVNLIDFSAVIVNVETLSSDIWNEAFARPIRTQLSRLLFSGGTVVVLGARPQGAAPSTNYLWCPIKIDIPNESGDTIEVKDTFFPRLNSFFTSWNFYFKFPSALPTDELHYAFESRELKFTRQSMVENRYGGMLFGTVEIQQRDKNTTESPSVIYLFARRDGQEDKHVIRVMLEEMFSIPQETTPPAWSDSVPVPLLVGIQAEIGKTKANIESLQSDMVQLEKKKQELNEYKKLLYADGKELEEIFARCLRDLGGTISPAQYSQEEYVLEYRGEQYLVECKGNRKSIALTDLRQLIDYLLKFEEEEGKPGKGILFGNAWKELPPNERATELAVIFPENVVSRASSNGIALVNSVDFFHVFIQFLEGQITADVILDRITESAGVVGFR